MPYDALAIAAPPPHVRTMPEASPHRTADSHPGYRLQANMRRGTGSSLAGTWSPYLTIEAAREAALEMLRDDRVARVTVVEGDALPPRFVEWVNR